MLDNSIAARGVAEWIRAFTIEMVERPLPARQPLADASLWRIIAQTGFPLRMRLEEELSRCRAGSGVAVCLPGDLTTSNLRLLLLGARLALGQQPPKRFVIIQQRDCAASFARSFHLEAPDLSASVITLAMREAHLGLVRDEIDRATRYSEAHYDESGKRFERVLRPLDLAQAHGASPLNSSDVLLVTGGGTGISAECAIALARDTGCKLALIGLTSPKEDAEVRKTLEKLRRMKVTHTYMRADVRNPSSIRRALGKVIKTMGPVTALIHGAGINRPCLAATLDESTFLETVYTKVEGARNVLAAIDTNRLRLFVSFSSVLACMGMPGQAHYALANEWLSLLTEEFGDAHPKCRCLAVEWSPWSQAGMVHRMGYEPSLAKAGISAIRPEVGTGMLQSLLSANLPKVRVVVMGRQGENPTLRFENEAPADMHFLRRVQLYYPGVELVAEAELEMQDDEARPGSAPDRPVSLLRSIAAGAMREAAGLVMGRNSPPMLKRVFVYHPLIASGEAPVTLQIAALATEPNKIEVVVRSSETGFQKEHVRSLWSY
jgi:enediyne polyketide synthase